MPDRALNEIFRQETSASKILEAVGSCKDRIQGSFMKNVLVKALPAGIADAVAIAAISLLGQKQGIPPAETATACTIILAWVGLAALVYISRPLNTLRVVLVICCAAGMVLTALVLPGIFEIVPLSAACVKLLIGCGAAGTVIGVLAAVLLSRRM